MASISVSPSSGGGSGGLLSPDATSPDNGRQGRSFIQRAKSANEVHSMAAIANMPVSANGTSPSGDESLNTLPDPRTPSPTPKLRSPVSNGDLASEVSVLSTKLINAINHNTSLDESLQQVRHELEASRKRIEELEVHKATHDKDVTDGVLLKKAEVDANIAQLRNELEQARREREASDKAKKQMEVEVESLTATLFEQANTMVADARRENEAAEKRNAQLRSQLQDTETLMASQQEQLQDLKGVVEKMSSERDETESAPHFPTAPSTPSMDTNKMSRIMDAIPNSPANPSDVQPDHPLRFAHLLVPVLRNDLQSYNDFADLLKTSRALNQISHNRSSSGQLNNRSPGLTSNPAASSSSPNLPGSFNAPSTPLTPTVASPRDHPSPLPPLKDSKFFKRSLTEDIEPVLRLDLAPGLSWLARRNVLTAIITGSLVIEPLITASSKVYGPVYSCALCGEDRKEAVYTRRHRFRTSDDISAQRYPLCEHCTGRLRSTCDFTAFLRMCRDGLWKAGTENDISCAWEEGVRLREKMFWARIGGGVVPFTAVKEAERVRAVQGEAIEGEAQDGGVENVGESDRVVLVRSNDHNVPIVRLSTPPNRRSVSTERSGGTDEEQTPVDRAEGSSPKDGYATQSKDS